MSVTIKWDQNAVRRVAEEAGRRAMDVARRAASSARCPDHHKAPNVTGTNPRTGEFTIEACCEKGKKAAIDVISRALR